MAKITMEDIYRSLGKFTPNLSHLYENHEVQDVLDTYLESLPSIYIPGIHHDRVVQLPNEELLLIPEDIKVHGDYDWATKAMVPVFNEETFTLENREKDFLTPRLQDFKEVAEIVAQQCPQTHLNGYFPSLYKGHWSTLVIKSKGGEYAWEQMDSLNDNAGFNFEKPKQVSLHGEIISSLEGVFTKKELSRLDQKYIKGFYTQSGVSCGPCLVQNVMMFLGLEKAETKRGVDAELRDIQSKKVKSIGWATQKVEKRLKAILDLIEYHNKELCQELVAALQNEGTTGFDGKRIKPGKVFINTCDLLSVSNKYENFKVAIDTLKITAIKVFFDGKYNTIEVSDEIKDLLLSKKEFSENNVEFEDNNKQNHNDNKYSDLKKALAELIVEYFNSDSVESEVEEFNPEDFFEKQEKCITKNDYTSVISLINYIVIHGKYDSNSDISVVNISELFEEFAAFLEKLLKEKFDLQDFRADDFFDKDEDQITAQDYERAMKLIDSMESTNPKLSINGLGDLLEAAADESDELEGLKASLKESLNNKFDVDDNFSVKEFVKKCFGKKDEDEITVQDYKGAIELIDSIKEDEHNKLSINSFEEVFDEIKDTLKAKVKSSLYYTLDQVWDFVGQDADHATAEHYLQAIGMVDMLIAQDGVV